jgi:hypothetical protein
MKLLISATLGDDALGFRRRIGWLLGGSFFIVLGVGFLFDMWHVRGSTRLWGPLPYLSSFAIILTFAVLLEAALALTYSSARLRRNVALLRQGVDVKAVLISVYLRRDVRRFLVGDGNASPFGAFEESVTLEFNSLGVRVWAGSSKPRLLRSISWADLEPLVVEKLERAVPAIQLSRSDEPSLTASALVAWGVLGIRRRGVSELVSSAESLRPVDQLG